MRNSSIIPVDVAVLLLGLILSGESTVFGIPPAVHGAREVTVKEGVSSGRDQATSKKQESRQSGVSKTVRVLLRQLAAPDFAVRQRAEKRLLELGSSIVPALIAASDSEDPELNQRARRVAIQLKEEQYEKKLELLLQDDETWVSELPGWKEYMLVAGDSSESRDLYARMLRKERDLLERFADADETLPLHIVRTEETAYALRQNVQPDVATVATLLFLRSQCLDRLLRVDNASKIYQFVRSNSTFREAVQKETEEGPLHGLLAAWVRSPLGSSSAYMRMQVGLTYNLPDALEPAVEVVRDQPNLRQYAILVVAKYGNAVHVSELESLLELEPNANEKRQRIDTQALAIFALARVTGQKETDYGLGEIETINTSDYRKIRFDNDTERETAIANWNKWRASQFFPSQENSVDAIEGERF